VSPLVDLDRPWWWAAAPPREVAEEFNGLLRDREVRAIFSLTGGRMTFSYLDLIDYEAVRADPKPLLGFSDISTLHLALHARTGLVSLTPTVHAGFGEWKARPDLAGSRISTSVCSPSGAPVSLPGRRWRCVRAARKSAHRWLLNACCGSRRRCTHWPRTIRRRDLFWRRSAHPAVWDLRAATAGVLDRIAGYHRYDWVEPLRTDTLREVVLMCWADVTSGARERRRRPQRAEQPMPLDPRRATPTP
jgi:muramoyltetrapeptide carboxypeptidase